MTKHTPGPWKTVVNHNGDIMICDKKNFVVGEIADVFPEHVDGNANLIAAAPDLLEALKGCIDDPDYCAKRPLVTAKARAAIAKAEGI